MIRVHHARKPDCYSNNERKEHYGTEFFLRIHGTGRHVRIKTRRIPSRRGARSALGFDPTIVLNVPFDTPERREFANRLGGNFPLQDERIKGVVIPAPGQLRNHDPQSGECRLFPEHGVVLIVTDERGYETCFGFVELPEHIIDIHSAILADIRLGGRWWFRDFVDSPDLRFRAIVAKFSERGFMRTVKDEFA
jgi:hypothetical protein